MWEEWAKAHNTTTAAMTQAQKIEAEYNGIMQETKFQVGDAAAYTKTFGGQIQQLKFNFNQMTVAIGKVVAPLAQLFIPVINSAMNAVTALFNKIQSILKTFGLEMPDVVSKSSSSLSGFSSEVSGAADDAVASAKKINKAFSNVDEINVISNNNQSSSGSGSGGGSVESSGSSTSTGSGGLEESAEKANSAFSTLKDRLLELQNLFKSGFDMTFDVDFKSFEKSIKNIKKQLQGIFTDKKLMKSVDSFVNSFSFNLGKIVGSTITIGANIAEGLVKSIETYLSGNSGRVSGFISRMFDIDTSKFNVAGNLMESLSSISEVLKSSIAVEIGNDILSMFVNPFMSLITVFTQFGSDMFSFLVTPITSNTELIKTSLENTLTSIEPLTDTLSNMFTSFGDVVTTVYDEHLAPFFESVTSGVSDTFSKFLNVYNEYVAPFFQHISENAKAIWDNHLKPLLLYQLARIA